MPDLIRHPPFFGNSREEGGPRVKPGVTIQVWRTPLYRSSTGIACRGPRSAASAALAGRRLGLALRPLRPLAFASGVALGHRFGISLGIAGEVAIISDGIGL